ncbi:MAG: tetratricopeptide repeat protein, partial [Bacteroidota bacterium]|nr:tetratricopeptide repeat protein [Bacteroidota bacterium]
MTGHLPTRATALSAALLFTTLIVTPLSGQGAGPERRALQKRVEELYTAGKYDSARIAAEQTLRHAEAHAVPGHPDIAESMSDLAVMDTYTNRLDAADSLYRLAIAMLEVAGDSTAGLLAIVLGNHANLHFSAGRYRDAEGLYARAAAALEHAADTLSPQYSITVFNLANTIRAQGR